MKKCVEMCVSVFEMLKKLLKISYQKIINNNDVENYEGCKAYEVHTSSVLYYIYRIDYFNVGLSIYIYIYI